MKTVWSLIVTVSFILLLNVSVNAQSKPIRVACIGNSITAGSGAPSDQSYPVQLGKLLGTHYDVKNYGVSGRTLLKKGDYPYWKEQAFISAKEFEPQIIIIKLGTNDTKTQNWIYKNEFFSDYMELIGEFRKGRVKPQIFIALPCPVFQTAYGIRDSIIRLVIPIIDSVHKAAHTDLIDFNTPLLGYGSYFPDGVHPNGQGYSILAQIAKDAILVGPAGVMRFFNSDKHVIEKGESATLYWEATGGSEVTINGTVVSEIDSLVVSPNVTTNYTIIAKGTDRSDTLSLELEYISPGKIKSFYAKPKSIEIGTNDSSQIYWTTATESQAFFNDLPVEANGSKIVFPATTTAYKLTTTGDITDQKEILVNVLPAVEINRSLDGLVKSSTAAINFSAENAIDGDPLTSWKSKNESSPWIYVDFEKVMDFKRVVLNWGSNYGILYRLQAVSETGAITTIYTQSSGKGGIEEITNLTGSGRYLRLLCSQKHILDSGYVLNEFEIYGLKKATSVNDEINTVTEFELSQNYPNPFNPSTTISYQLPEKSFVTLKVFDALGTEVATLVSEMKEAGRHTNVFNIEERGSATISSGIYFYQLRCSNDGNSLIKTKKMIALK